MFSAVRSFRALARVIPKRSYAAPASGGQPTDELRLTFSSPASAIFANTIVRQVDVPTLAGTVGILANHVPVIGVLKPGIVQVTDIEGNVHQHFVSSGTLSMNIDGSCQVLAEEILKIEDIDEAAARQELENAQRQAASGGSEVDIAESNIRAEVAEALIKAATGQQI